MLVEDVYGDTMKNILTNVRTSSIINLIIVSPFIVLELVNRRSFHEVFPIVLLGLLWFLPVIFIFTLIPIMQSIKAGNRFMANPTFFLLRVVLLLLIAGLWGALVSDQIPCFLGVPNCD